MPCGVQLSEPGGIRFGACRHKVWEGLGDHEELQRRHDCVLCVRVVVPGAQLASELFEQGWPRHAPRSLLLVNPPNIRVLLVQGYTRHAQVWSGQPSTQMYTLKGVSSTLVVVDGMCEEMDTTASGVGFSGARGIQQVEKSESPGSSLGLL